MSDVVLAALIGAAASIIVNFLNTASQNKKRAIADAIKENNLENRLKAIEIKLDQHNGYAGKLESIQTNLGAIQTDIAVIKNDIKTLYKQA